MTRRSFPADSAFSLDGRTVALNHLAYFALTLRLLDRVVAGAEPGAPARILCVSSRAHRDAKLSLDDLQLEQQYAGWKAYANSKLANVLFTRALARRLDREKVVVHALHPGVVSTRHQQRSPGPHAPPHDGRGFGGSRRRR